MMRKILYPNELKFLAKYHKSRKDLVRLGGFRDGGYVLSYKDVIECNVLISGGVGSSARFESDCLDLNPILNVILVDKSFSKIRMFLRFFYHLLKNKDKGYNSLIESISALRVLNRSTLIKKFFNQQFTLEDIPILGNNQKLLIKLDIEGDEYSQLESLLNLEPSIKSLCVEFHGLAKEHNLKALENFLRKTGLKLIFISINETSLVKGIPDILELCFSGSCDDRTDPSFLQASCFPGELESLYFG